ncbi:MAG: hypothetical protein RMK30_07675 [Anaerolineae bacterium]|nr:YfhO family protein [Anaerolineae bacterium]MDW8102738.1 hypothetical protein [Anaerolineae bacterium]
MKIWLILSLPLLPWVPYLGEFAFPKGNPYSDILVAHYPNFIYLRKSITSWHTVPFWSPLIFSGYPFFANPLSGLWYPPGWLGVILPLPLAFNFLILAHLLWGAVGLYMLARTQGIGERGALLSALAWEVLPKTMAHYGAGHLTLVYALSWTPWLLTAEILWPRWVPVFLALTFLATPQWAGYAFVLWLIWSLRHTIKGQGLNHIPAWGWRAARKVALASLLSFSLLIPLLEFTFLSTRSRMTPSDVLVFSLPFPQLLGFFFPSFGSFHEFFIYPGAVVVTLAIAGGFNRFWWLTALVSLAWALGENLPAAHLVASLPGISLLRVPSRSIFITCMALTFLAGEGVERFIAGIEGKALKRARLSLVALPAFCFMLTIGLWVLEIKIAIWALWGAMAFVLAAFLAWKLHSSGSIHLWLALIAFLVLENWGVNLKLLDFRSPQEVLAEKAEVAEFLARQQRPFRVYAHSYVLPPHTTALYGLEMASGIDPLHLKAYASFMEGATGVPYGSYSVTIPPLTGEDPFTANKGYAPDPRKLGLLNVKYVASGFPLEVEGLKEIARFGEVRIYENDYARPRAWVEDSSGPRPVDYWEWAPNRLRLKARGPGLLVVSEIAYPGWEGFVDGKKRPVEVVGGVLRGISLEEGMHEIEMRFRPLSLKMGLVGLISGLCFLFLEQRFGKMGAMALQKGLAFYSSRVKRASS